MRLIAVKHVELGGLVHTPGTEFDAGDDEAKKLVKAGDAKRKDSAAATPAEASPDA
jgi:hypothetical protein